MTEIFEHTKSQAKFPAERVIENAAKNDPVKRIDKLMYCSL